MSVEWEARSQISPTPLIGLLSRGVEQHTEIQHHLDLNVLKKPYSDIIWTLWRIGVTDIIAHPIELKFLTHALNHLEPAPPLVNHQSPILKQLHRQRRERLQHEPEFYSPWSQHIRCLDIPSSPLQFDHLKLCFHDELIGAANAFLIHYGESHYEVSGYHPPISAISVPISSELTVLVIAQLPYQSTHTDQIDHHSPDKKETCVMHLSAEGLLLKGPWWPKLQQQSN